MAIVFGSEEAKTVQQRDYENRKYWQPTHVEVIDRYGFKSPRLARKITELADKLDADGVELWAAEDRVAELENQLEETRKQQKELMDRLIEMEIPEVIEFDPTPNHLPLLPV